MSVLLAQLSDTHVTQKGSDHDRTFKGAARLAAAVEHLNTLPNRPDAVFLSGDLVDTGAPEEYAHFRDAISGLRAPFYLQPGNHDARDALRAAFPDHDYLPREGFLDFTVSFGGLRLVCLDTLIPGEAGGRLCMERLGWLDETLAHHGDEAIIVSMHHPPFLTGLAKMDRMGLDGIDGLEEVLSRYDNVERVVAGHVHRHVQTRFAGTLACTCPSTIVQIGLELENENRLSLVDEPPGALLHFFSKDTGLVTHASPIGEYGPPYVIYENGAWGPQEDT